MNSKLDQIIRDDNTYLFQNYGNRLPVAFERGDGALLYDQDNNEYIDFFAGVAVCNFGYNHPAITAALHDQINNLMHSSNWYYNTKQIDAARLLSELAFDGRTLFVNSGTEANEAAIKLSRRHGLSHDPDKYRIITFSRSFHGRTFGSMSATGQEKIRQGFGPLVPGFTVLDFNDISAFNHAAGVEPDTVCAVILELVQGEGGINQATPEFVDAITRFCEQHHALLVIDEIQTGIGRTGKPFAFQHYGINPDVITLAKGLGGGIPVGAIHTKPELVEYLPAGSHGTTFGGNHLASAAAHAALRELANPELMAHVSEMSEYFFTRLKSIASTNKIIKDIRGLGLHIGVELDVPGMGFVKKALAEKLVINCTSEKVLRIMPPLVIDMNLAERGLDILERILKEEAAS